MGRHQSNIIYLTEQERTYLEAHCRKGEWSPRVVLRAKILLLADQNYKPRLDHEIAEMLKVSLSTVRYRRKRFELTKCIEDTLFDQERSGRPTIVDGAVEAHMTMIACSSPPEGQATWTLRLIRDRIVTLEIVDNISHATVGRTLKKKK